MDVNSLDYNKSTLVQKTPEVAKMQTDNQTKNQAVEQQQVKDIKGKAEQEVNTVSAKGNVENNKIDNNKQNKDKRESKKRNKNYNKNKKQVDDEETATSINLKV